MIKIIEEIRVYSLDSDAPEWKTVPIVPASATMEISGAYDDNGRKVTRDLSGVITEALPELSGRTMVQVDFCDGTSDSFGSEDLPVWWELTEGQNISFSVTHESASW